MICKNCGFEYEDGLKECPNCQAPNVPDDPQVLSQQERDTFEGLTIETPKEEDGADQGEYKVYDQEEERARREEAENKDSGIHVKVFSGMNIIWIIIFILAVLGILIFILPVFAMFFVAAAVCYFLYSWLF